MADASASQGGLDVLGILYTVSRYLFPLLMVVVVALVFLFFFMEIRNRREKARSLPGSGTVGELVVLSGSRELDANTWFPVPREGVLGSVRSCDLVIPCPGVHSKHLDFSWADGLGLLIRPYTGCEAQINGTPVTCRTDAASVPVTHGSVLQVGSAVLRLHLFAALDNTAPVQPEAVPFPLPEVFPVSEPLPAPDANPAPYMIPVPENYTVPFSPPVQNSPGMPVPGILNPAAQPPDIADVPPAEPSTAINQERPRPRRSDRWKEDFGE